MPSNAVAVSLCLQSKVEFKYSLKKDEKEEENKQRLFK